MSTDNEKRLIANRELADELGRRWDLFEEAKRQLVACDYGKAKEKLDMALAELKVEVQKYDIWN